MPCQVNLLTAFVFQSMIMMPALFGGTDTSEAWEVDEDHTVSDANYYHLMNCRYPTKPRGWQY